MIQLRKGQDKSLWQDMADDAHAVAAEASTPAANKELEAAHRGRRRARRQVLERYEPLISELARSLTAGTAHEFLLMEAGREALVQALEVFDRAQGWDRFPGFARMFIERRMRQIRKAPHTLR